MIITTAIGRLTDDPELRYVGDNETPQCRFRIACDKARGRKGTNYLAVVVWGAAAEANAEYLRKGRQIGVSGNLEHNQWQTPEGIYRERYELNANDITWLALPRHTNGESANGEPASSEPVNGEQSSAPAPAPKPETTTSAKTKVPAKKASAKKPASKAKVAAGVAAGPDEEPF